MNIKLLGKNTLVYAVGNIGLRTASFLLIPLYTHILTISEYGLLVTLLFTIQIMFRLINLGMPDALIRFAKEYDNKNLMGQLIGTSILINIFSGIAIAGLSITCFIPFFRLILHSDEVFFFVLISCFAALAQSLCNFVLSYYRARNKAIVFMSACISAALLLIIFNLVLVLIFNKGIHGVLIAQIIAYSTIFIILFFNVVSKIGIKISFSLMPKLLNFGFPLIFSTMGRLTIDSSAVYFISYFAGLSYVAIFSLGYKLAQAMEIVLILPFQLAYGPFVFANIDKQKIKVTISRVLTYFVLAIACTSFVILLLSKKLLPLIAPPGYSSAYLVLIFLLPIVALKGISFYGEIFLQIVKKTHIVGTTIALLASLSLLLNYKLIPELNWYGAVISSNISYLAIVAIILAIGIKVFPVKLEWLRLGIGSGLFFFFLSIFFLFNKVDDTLFYVASLLIFGCSLGLTYFFGFFNDQEKGTINRIIYKVVTITKQ